MDSEDAQSRDWKAYGAIFEPGSGTNMRKVSFRVYLRILIRNSINSVTVLSNFQTRCAYVPHAVNVKFRASMNDERQFGLGGAFEARQASRRYRMMVPGEYVVVDLTGGPLIGKFRLHS